MSLCYCCMDLSSFQHKGAIYSFCMLPYLLIMYLLVLFQTDCADLLLLTFPVPSPEHNSLIHILGCFDKQLIQHLTDNETRTTPKCSSKLMI